MTSFAESVSEKTGVASTALVTAVSLISSGGASTAAGKINAALCELLAKPLAPFLRGFALLNDENDSEEDGRAAYWRRKGEEAEAEGAAEEADREFEVN